jgi:uncharacterized protein (TIRG00374 family)
MAGNASTVVESDAVWRRRARSGALLGIAAVSLYLFLPGIVAVFASWRSLSHLDWLFAFLVLACVVASYFCIWDLDRVALQTRSWFAVATAQLTGNAVGRILPGGAATSTAFSSSMLRKAGIESDRAAIGFAAATVLQIAAKLALPVLALPAIVFGAPVDHSLETAAYLGLAAFVLLVLAGLAAFVSDAPLEWAGRALQWLLNHTVRRRRPVHNLSQIFLEARDFIARAIGSHWQRAVLGAAGSTAFDYFALLCALRAVGTSPRPSLVLLAYASAQLLALIPFTPGGVGFVEAGLVGTLTLAGVSGTDALAATLLYRLASYWLPLPAGAVAYVLYRRRYADA